MGYINLLDMIYPVGSIYFSMDSASPSEIIGGVWTRIVDKCIRGSDNINIVGDDTSILSLAQIPSHKHVLYMGSIPNNGAYNPGYAGYLGIDGFGGNNNWNSIMNFSTTYSGESKTHNNLPAAQNMYIWYRVS